MRAHRYMLWSIEGVGILHNRGLSLVVAEMLGKHVELCVRVAMIVDCTTF